MSNQQAWFLDIQERPSPTDVPTQSVRITAVAPDSPAAALNLAPKDWFVRVNDTPAACADVPEILVSNEQVTYEFLRQSDNTRIIVLTAALPLGIRTELTSEDIVASYQSKSVSEFDGLRILWERQAYSQIRRICDAQQASNGTADEAACRDLLIAVCDLEEGVADSQKAYDTVVAFNKKHGDFLTTDVTGILDYYLAQKFRAEDDMHRYQSAMMRAMESPYNQASTRLKAEADANNVTYRTTSPHVGGTFGKVEGMELLVGDKTHTWNDATVTPYCLMLTFRGNKPYDNALKVYRSVYPFLQNTLRPMIVMTSERDRPTDHPEHFASEDALISEGVPFYVLYGYKTAWADLVLACAPEFIAVDNQTGKILWHADLNDDYAYWEMMALVGTPG
ncbi:hypothetical protein GCM10008090_07850 [Arenicella chitinivorans]|uniref:PDZ domain-containing protein n=1 Tax=Arenicella chitinivorans TaxID=1329800 RepID=A0A918RL14_9GAMM|nr:hypothetical protein [Arenicella chitinivorans]GHA01171.1 hypothetical protein GCM10008090_07850 [Arenicella chitinivorans]